MTIDQRKRSKLVTKYLRRGLALLPIAEAVPGKLETGKRPSTAHGYKDATSSRTAIREAFARTPSANLAVATGSKSNVLILDVDPRHGGVKTLDRLEAQLGSLPKTWRVRTSRDGEHIYFRWPAGLKLTRDSAGKILGPGLDVLGEASYAVMPPSVHATGHVYRWRSEKALAQLPAKLPAPWRKALKKAGRSGSGRKSTASSAPLRGPIKSGSRNNSLFRMAAGWRAGGSDENELIERLRKVNAERCQPPLEDDELKKIAKSAADYAGPSAKLDLAGVLAEAVLADEFSNGRHLVHQAGQFHRFNGTCWEAISEDKLKKAVLRQLRGLNNRAHIKTASVMSEAVAVLRASQEADNDLFAERTEPLPIINCENGEVWLDENGHPKLRPHKPKSGQLQTLAVSYIPTAECPEYDRALTQIFGNAKDPEGMIRHWHELVGYIIQPTRPYPAIVVLLGKGANGKTKLLGTLSRLLGQQATFFGNIESVETSRFALGALRGKRLFVDDDVKMRLKLPDGMLKKISEAKPITGEEKYRNPTTFTSRAVPFLLCNGIPFLQDVSHGMLRRLHILSFGKTFSGDEKDPMLFDRIWADEMPGILNRCLEGWERLKRRGDFHLPKDAKRMAKKWVVQANPFAAYVDECVIRGIEGKIPLAKLYEHFALWAKEAGIQRGLTRQTLGVDLENLGFLIKKSNGERVVYGLELR